MRDKTKELPSPEKAAVEWIELKAEKARIEARFDILKDALEPFLKAQPEMQTEINGWKFSLVESERESFQLSKAKEKIDGRVLAPYITHSHYNQIRTTWKGGKE